MLVISMMIVLFPVMIITVIVVPSVTISMPVIMTTMTLMQNGGFIETVRFTSYGKERGCGQEQRQSAN